MMYGLPPSFSAPTVPVAVMPPAYLGFSPYGLPQHAQTPSSLNGKAVLQRWFDENLENPYPNNHDKQMLGRKAQMTPVQINNWFANARRRIKKRGLSKSPSPSSSKCYSDSSRSPSPQPPSAKKQQTSSAFNIENLLNSPPVCQPFLSSPFPMLTPTILPFNPYLAALQQLQLAQQIPPTPSPSGSP
ncbi:hypothetical protein QR680_009688 [Steinernema hermaphroditum]|uniref:Homeobox domain-containing protein n=1 Tax=Steinernema hermaphroditum TaxID=289476 RepID=A0AA39ILA5_9BILA|nr:hypothetical protein QR680_009688 [Steinernema hermaphroditum]